MEIIRNSCKEYAKQIAIEQRQACAKYKYEGKYHNGSLNCPLVNDNI